jgi:hypothetical protein
MKYVIIALVLTALLAITAYILDFTNDKTDKIFLIIVGSLLIISGLFFSIKGEVFKDTESKAQAESLTNTKKNTEELKEKSELIIANINENLEKLIVINDSVSVLNEALSGVEKDLSKQLEVFNKTLDQTKIFEQKVNEQLALEKKRFELEKPEVEVVASLENKSDINGKKYGIRFEFRNLGKRVAKDFNTDAIVGIAKDKRNLTEHLKMEGSTESLDITPMQSGGVSINVRSGKLIDAEGIEEDLRLVILLKYSYKDEFLNQTFEKELYFFWYGFDKSGLKLLSANNKEFTDRLDTYIENNNLKF